MPVRFVFGSANPSSGPSRYTHHAMAALAHRSLLHEWVQQNHDGLPQKAGFPQEFINEVHGAWYDPSNPVVKYTGCLRTAEAEWMEQEAQKADLVLVMGTSLGGASPALRTVPLWNGEPGQWPLTVAMRVSVARLQACMRTRWPRNARSGPCAASRSAPWSSTCSRRRRMTR